MSALPKDLTPRALAIAGWGEELPDWIEALVLARESRSQGQLSKELGLSPATLAQALRNTYPSALDNIETAVRRLLMREVVNCPELGEIEPATCESWAAKSDTYVSSTRLNGVMRRACRCCPLKPRSR